MTTLTRIAALLAACAGGATAAQPAEPSPGGYRSALDSYQPFAEQPVGSWREANDTVGRIGGWRAYAREAQAPAPQGSTKAETPSPSTPARDAAAPTPAPAPGPTADPHAGHH